MKPIENVLRWRLQQVSRGIFATLRCLRALLTFLKRRASCHQHPGLNEASETPTQQSKATNKTNDQPQLTRVLLPSSCPSPRHVGSTSSGAATPSRTSTQSVRPTTPSPARNSHTSGYINTTGSSYITAPLSRPFAVVPDFMRRNELRVPVQRLSNETTIAPGKLHYSETAPDGWQRIVHPEGARYFYNTRMCVFADVDLNDARDLADIEAYVGVLRKEERRIIPHLGHETQLVIQRVDLEESSERVWCYYFVHHDTCTLFWVTPFEAHGLFGNLEGVVADSHIGYAIEEQYWAHCERYPSCLPLAKELVNEVWGTIAQASTVLHLNHRSHP